VDELGPNEIVEQTGNRSVAGVQRVMLQ